jgi:Rod binding domain-containing protein
MNSIDTTVALSNAQAKPRISNINAGDKALKAQTDAFEAVLLKQVLDVTMKGDTSLFPKGPGSDIYKSMYTDTMSKNLAGGFGFSEMLFNYLKENR